MEKTTFDTLCGKCGRTIYDGQLFVFGSAEMQRRLGMRTEIICPKCLYKWAKEQEGEDETE